MSNKLEQLEFKLEKNIGIQKHAGKVRKDCGLNEKNPIGLYYDNLIKHFFKRQ